MSLAGVLRTDHGLFSEAKLNESSFKRGQTEPLFWTERDQWLKGASKFLPLVFLTVSPSLFLPFIRHHVIKAQRTQLRPDLLMDSVAVTLFWWFQITLFPERFNFLNVVKAYFSAVVKGKIDSEACLNIINIFVCQVYASLNSLFKNSQGFTFGESVGFRTSCFFLCFLSSLKKSLVDPLQPLARRWVFPLRNSLGENWDSFTFHQRRRRLVNSLNIVICMEHQHWYAWISVTSAVMPKDRLQDFKLKTQKQPRYPSGALPSRSGRPCTPQSLQAS